MTSCSQFLDGRSTAIWSLAATAFAVLAFASTADAAIGDLGISALRAVKERLDPAGIMNPGKLLP